MKLDEKTVINHALAQAVHMVTQTPPWRRMVAFIQAEASSDAPDMDALRAKIMKELGQRVDQAILAAKRTV